MNAVGMRFLTQSLAWTSEDKIVFIGIKQGFLCATALEKLTMQTFWGPLAGLLFQRPFPDLLVDGASSRPAPQPAGN